MKLIKRDLFTKLMYDDETECYYIYNDNTMLYRFYATSKSSAIKIYNEFKDDDLKWKALNHLKNLRVI